MIRYTVHFAGRVQGVGFRYAATRVAEPFMVAGYVRNLEDGRVRLVAEGEETQLQQLVLAILQQMHGYVKSHQIDRSPATGEFGTATPGGLRVRY